MVLAHGRRPRPRTAASERLCLQRMARLRSGAFLVGMLSAGYLLAATAYGREANEFYLRVFGYYVSLSQ